MKVSNHRLILDSGSPCSFSATPNIGGKLDPEYLVMHFTAGKNAQQSIDWLCNKAAKASAHLVIGRDGTITQLVPFNRVAWHAGVSSWEGRKGMNQYSIGIELDNAGRLTLQGGKWRAWFGTEITEKDMIEAVHKSESRVSGWQLYTPEQLDAAMEAAAILVDHYDLKDVVGHEDIAPGRKSDPGPAFPMTSFRAHVLGRIADIGILYETTDTLNIRKGPGTGNDPLPGSPLPPGTQLEILEMQGSWAFVDVLSVINGIMDMQGWVHNRYLKRLA